MSRGPEAQVTSLTESAGLEYSVHRAGRVRRGLCHRDAGGRATAASVRVIGTAGGGPGRDSPLGGVPQSRADSESP